jgi:hypothetical protein
MKKKMCMGRPYYEENLIIVRYALDWKPQGKMERGKPGDYP